MAKKRKNPGIWIWIVVAVVVVLIGGYFFVGNSENAEVNDEPGEYDEFTRCLVDSGVKMYGSVTCSVCAQQKKLFGNSFRFIDEIECNPHEKDNEAERCLEREVSTTPTWVLEKNGEEVERLVGYQSFETLSELSGCTL
jgi:uncharacterized protein YneF (UPF0154 family)